MLSDTRKEDYYDMFFSAEELSQEEFEFIHAINNGKKHLEWNDEQCGIVQNIRNKLSPIVKFIEKYGKEEATTIFLSEYDEYENRKWVKEYFISYFPN